MGEQERMALAELVELYARTKRVVLQAEQFDPDSRSNISVFKEQRDALDHLMRALAAQEALATEQQSKYFHLQLDKAKGHLYRAAYDSLDGLAISYKLGFKELVEGLSKDTLHALFPDYHGVLARVRAIDLAITERRNAKDIGRDTLENLEKYCEQVEELFQLSQEGLRREHCLRDAQQITNRINAMRTEIEAAMRGFSNDAIDKLYPAYRKHLLDLALVSPSGLAGGGGVTPDQQVERLHQVEKRVTEIFNETRMHVEALRDWTQRDHTEKRTKDFLRPLGVGIVLLIIGAVVGRLLPK